MLVTTQKYSSVGGGGSRLDCYKIWHDYKCKVFSYIAHYVSDSDDVQDLVSSVFEKIVKKSDSYRGNPAAVSSFVYTITRNKVIDYYRIRRKSAEIPESLQSSELLEDDILKNEVLETLSVSLSFLPEDERKVIVFHY